MTHPKNPGLCVIVLGMHRSGTSFLTGSLQNAGLELGKHSTWNRHNRRGNRENDDIVELNDKVLTANDGNWLSPPQRIKWSDEQLTEGKELIKSFIGTSLYGFKDPRTLITLTGWKKLIPNYTFVGIFRHPSAVVKSLMARGQVTESEGLQAWIHYNSLLLKQYKKHRFPLLNFDWPEDQLQQGLEKVYSHLNLEPHNSEDFYTKDLRNQSKNQEINVSLRAKLLYWQLCRHANRGLN